MPRLRPTETELRSRCVRATISRNMELYGLSEDQIASKIHTTKRTVQNKRKRPETFTLEELWTLSDVLKFTDEEKQKMFG